MFNLRFSKPGRLTAAQQALRDQLEKEVNQEADARMAGYNPAGANPRVPPQQQQPQHPDGAEGGQDGAGGVQGPPDWMRVFALLQQQLQQQQQQADFTAFQQQHTADMSVIMAAINPQPKIQPPQRVQGPCLQVCATAFVPAPVATAPAAVAGPAPPIPVGPAFDLVGGTFFKDAIDNDGCDPVTVGTDKEVLECTAIEAALANPTAPDFRDALILLQ